MKPPIIGPLLNTAALLLLLGSFIASVRHTQAVGFRTRSVDGYLLVYSATDEVSDGDLVFNAHSSYLIYTTDGKLFKSVENHMSPSDEIPGRVSLPAGSYIVEARSANNGYVRVHVVIKPSRLTLLDLDSRDKESSSGIARN
jgi:hypothetical protein